LGCAFNPNSIANDTHRHAGHRGRHAIHPATGSRQYGGGSGARCGGHETLGKRALGALFAAVLIGIAVAGWYHLHPSGPGAGFVSGNGRVEATEIDLATKPGGRVEAILVNEGDFVHSGQLLASMRIDVLAAQRDEAQAQSRQAVNAVASAEAQVSAKRSETMAAQATVVLRASEQDAAQRRFTRTEQLAPSTFRRDGWSD